MNVFAYLDGRWIPSDELSLAVDDVGFLFGATVAERLRTFGGQVFRLEQHIERLRCSLSTIGLGSETIGQEVEAALVEFVERNRAQIAPEDDWSLVAFATPGVLGSGRPTVCVYGFPLTFEQWSNDYEHGVPLVVSDVVQVPTNCWPSELKCRSRMHYYLAERQAAEREPGARALLVDQDGYVAETTTANVLLYSAEAGLLTPPGDHILFGVSVGFVEELAGELGLPFTRRLLSVEELRRADEVMVASTSICLLPAVHCDGEPIGDGRPGPVYGRLLAAWSESVGVDVAAQARMFADRG